MPEFKLFQSHCISRYSILMNVDSLGFTVQAVGLFQQSTQQLRYATL